MSDRDKTAGKRRGAGSSSALNEPKNKVAKTDKTNQASVSGKFVILQTNVKIRHDMQWALSCLRVHTNTFSICCH